MRIAIISPPWVPVPPPLYGGIELVVDRLAVGLQRAGHDVLLYTTGDSTCPVPKAWALEESEGQRIGMGVPEIRHVMHAYETVRDFDIVHDHTMFGPIYSEHITNQPVVTTIHGPFNTELSEIYERIADRVPIIGISHAQHAPVPHIPIARVIHHGVDAVDFPMNEKSGDYCLFLGRLSPDKGAHRAVIAAREAGVPLFIIGKMREAWEFEYFEEFVKPNLTSDIEYLGEVEHEKKIELLHDAKAMLFPIRWNEPFGMVMLEAFACGTPVIAFPEGAAPEVVDHGRTGFLVDNEQEMAEAIGRVGEINRADCRASVEGYFSTDRMVAEHVALFEELLANR